MDTKPSMLPFNIDLLIPTDNQIQMIPRINVLDIFHRGSSRNFHPEGLFSVEYFGKVGEEIRSRRFAYIDLKIKILHPIIYKALTSMKGLYEDIISGKTYAIFDPTIKDFIKSTPIEGNTGYNFFIQHLDKINFTETGSIAREFNIKVIKKYLNNCQMDKLLVLPAGLRDFEITESGKPEEDECNTLYRKVLALSNLIQLGVYQHNPENLDDTRYSIQLAVNEIYNYFRSLVDGKKKLIQGKWSSRKIHNGTRNVITALQSNVDTLHNPRTVSFNQTVVGVYQYMKGTLPLTIYNLKNGFLSRVFVGPNSPAIMVNKTTRKRELVNVDSKLYDDYMTNEGLEKIISNFGEDDLRHQYLEYGNYYFGLIYKGLDGTYALIQDIDDVPEGYNKNLVYPLTFYELVYLSIYKKSEEICGFITRYPITSRGSVYGSFTYLKSTVKSEIRKELDSSFTPTGYIAYEFPIYEEKSMVSLSPHFSRLGRLGADEKSLFNYND